MKHAKLIALALALCLLAALLLACSDPAMRAAAGKYTGQYSKLVGDETKNEEPFTLTLNADGSGTHARDGMEFKVSWTLEGEKFTMKESFIGDPIAYSGTLKDGVLDIFNGDPNDPFTYNYVYKKQ